MEHIKELEAFGVIDDIYTAIDSYDMAKIVTAATNALKKARCIDNARTLFKSEKMSEIALIDAHKLYEVNLYNFGVISNNMALAVAPSVSRELIGLAYGMRAEIMFRMKNYAECQEDVKTCLSMNCSKSNPKQLKKLSNACKVPLVFKCINELNVPSFVKSFFLFDCARNADVPCASADVTFINQEGAKRASAGKRINAGAVVAIERAYSSCIDIVYLTCNYCHKITPRLYPCDGCCHALFCSNECRDQCIDEYHRIECQIVDYIKIIYKEPHNVLMTRTAIKLSLKLGWDALIEASENIGASRMKTATIRQTYNSDDSLSMLSYDDDKNCFEGKFFEGSIICARVLHQLDKLPNYFPKESSKRKAAKEALSRIMLRLYATFNTIPITICAREVTKDTNGDLIKVTHNQGWFSMSSKLKHSCEPNLMVVGLNDKVALVALRTINEGEELTISYIDHFYMDSNKQHLQTPHRRATKLFMQTGYICKDCRVCDGDWDANSDDIPTVMTRKQAFLSTKADLLTGVVERFRNSCEFLDAFPVRTSNHKIAFKNMYCIMFEFQNALTNNKTITC